MNWNQYIKSFQHYLKLERGLSQNTIDNYTFDLQRLCSYLDQNNISVSPINIQEETIQQFIYTISKELNARTQARILSGLKAFFNYLIFEDYRNSNPMELIESPKIARKLPDTLSINEIDKLIQAIDLSKKEGERNRAIIETLYGCGLRVSELVNLKISDLFFEEDFIRVSGKGNKQRFVPIATHTKKYIEIYKSTIRNKLQIKKNFEDTLFFKSTWKTTH